MDEVKNLAKDRIAHKEYPLPRGLIKKEEAVAMIRVMQIILFAYSLIIWVLASNIPALAYACLALYLWLMYKEFGAGHWLNQRPLLYGTLHQLAVVPMVIFAVTIASPQDAFAGSTWSFALMLMGAFFTYEICHKLDPHAHPVLATYIHFYGFRKTFEIAAIMLALSAMGAISLDLASLLIPAEIFVLVTLSLLFFQAAWFRLPEIASSLSLLLHIWGITIQHFLVD